MFPWEAKFKADPKYVISLELSVTSVIPDTKTLVKPLWVTKRQAEKAKAKEDTKITQANTQSASSITETTGTESHKVVFLQLLQAYNLGNDLKVRWLAHWGVRASVPAVPASFMIKANFVFLERERATAKRVTLKCQTQGCIWKAPELRFCSKYH